jgi:hypothetical protein
MLTNWTSDNLSNLPTGKKCKSMEQLSVNNRQVNEIMSLPIIHFPTPPHPPTTPPVDNVTSHTSHPYRKRYQITILYILILVLYTQAANGKPKDCWLNDSPYSSYYICSQFLREWNFDLLVSVPNTGICHAAKSLTGCLCCNFVLYSVHKTWT